MEKQIPLEKMSKKQRKEYYAKKRGAWGAVNPVTRVPENPKAYNRKKNRKESDNPYDFFVYFITICQVYTAALYCL